jgi:hypothetical protein
VRITQCPYLEAASDTKASLKRLVRGQLASAALLSFIDGTVTTSDSARY